jgi:hypothetical protein
MVGGILVALTIFRLSLRDVEIEEEKITIEVFDGEEDSTIDQTDDDDDEADDELYETEDETETDDGAEEVST